MMVRSYNSRLLPMHEKGECGDEEFFDSDLVLNRKVSRLVDLLKRSKHTVVFTGAGVSTSCGIADFRGPNGVWTKELNGVPVDPSEDTSECFDRAVPSATHYALRSLLDSNMIHHIVSQNVDGLHMRSGVFAQLTELHGNIYLEECLKCGRLFFRDHDVGGMGLRSTGNRCDITRCGGELIDNAVDWDTALPEDKFAAAETHMSRADLVLCLGTSLRIRPAGNMPLRVLKKSRTRESGDVGKLAIVNLQTTHLDTKAEVKISHYCDEVMTRVCALLGVEIKSDLVVTHCVLEERKKPRRKRPAAQPGDDGDSDGEKYVPRKRKRIQTK